MLKKRIIPIQLLLDRRLVKTQNFANWRDVGDPVKSSAVYNSQYADELIFLDISRDSRDVSGLAKLIEAVSAVCFMPVSMGGGIRTADDAAFLILHGADKVVVNSVTYSNLNIIAETAKNFGTQAVVAGIDAAFDEDISDYVLYSHCGQRRERVGLSQHVRRCIEAGAGEIMIQSIDRDGTMSGYDLELINRTVVCSNVPIIAAGGSGNYEHLKAVFLETDISAVACGSLFNFSDSNPIRAKAFLSNYGLPFKRV